MRVIAASLLLAAPALVSALATPVRRSMSGWATWYITETGNAGSCGDYLHDGDYTIALNSNQYSQDLCGKTVTVTANGKTTQATIKDLCPEGGGNCHWGDMDMSPGLFTFFNPLTVGKFEIQWDFTDGSAPPAPPPQDPSPYVEPPVPTTPTQDPVPVVEPSPNTNTPIIDSLPVYENAVQYDDETPVVEGPIPTPTADYVEPTPTPWTETTDCTTTTESSSAAPTPTPPTFAEQIAIAMKEHDVNGLGAVLVELGNIFQGSTDTTTTDTATTTTTTY